MLASINFVNQAFYLSKIMIVINFELGMHGSEASKASFRNKV